MSSKEPKKVLKSSSKSYQKVLKVLKKFWKATKGPQIHQSHQKVLKRSSKSAWPQVHNWSSKGCQSPQNFLKMLSRGTQKVLKILKGLTNVLKCPESPQVLKISSRRHQKFLKMSPKFSGSQVHRSWKTFSTCPRIFLKMSWIVPQKVLKSSPKSFQKVLKNSSEVPQTFLKKTKKCPQIL